MRLCEVQEKLLEILEGFSMFCEDSIAVRSCGKLWEALEGCVKVFKIVEDFGRFWHALEGCGMMLWEVVKC